MSTLTEIPDPLVQGASKFGSSFIKAYRDCPTKWWYQFWAPAPGGALGLVPPILGKPLAIGQHVHVFLAEYHTSEGDFDKAWKVMMDGLANYEGPIIEDKEAVWDECDKLTNKYHEFWDGNHPKVVYVDGEPVVERDLVLHMGYSDYTYTARLDALVEWEGHICPFEHKTVDTSRYTTLLIGAEMDNQITGQDFLVKNLLAELNPVGVLLNCLIKRRAKGKDAYSRTMVYRTPLALEKFRLDTVRTLRDIDLATEEYQSLAQLGMEPFEAARQAYPQHGTLDCNWCPYMQLCLNPTKVARYAATFLPRASVGGTLREEKEKEN